MIRGWRLWTWWARWREHRYGDPQEGWTVTAITKEIEHQEAKTGRHRLRRQP